MLAMRMRLQMRNVLDFEVTACIPRLRPGALGVRKIVEMGHSITELLTSFKVSASCQNNRIVSREITLPLVFL